MLVPLRRSLPLTLGLVLVPAFVAAQPDDSLQVKVRSGPDGLLTGRGIVTRPDTLTFLPDGRSDTLTLAFDSIRELRVRRGDQSHFWAGLGIGAGVGALVGTVAGYADGDDRVDQTCLFCNLMNMSAEEKAGIGALVGGALGAVSGSVIGGFVRTPRFVRIPPRDLGVKVSRGSDGSLRVAVTAPWPRPADRRPRGPTRPISLGAEDRIAAGGQP